ncbi:MAG: hypothetical protein M3378_06205 [Actinomycetota bacterium]|nr:hypothetical protein [Actinomycetota bacterium]
MSIVAVYSLTLTSPSGAAPVGVEKEACKDGAWQVLADGGGRPFKNQGECVAAANRGDAFLYPRFVEAQAQRSHWNLIVSFREVGLVSGSQVQYFAGATLTVTDLCRPLSGSGTAVTRSYSTTVHDLTTFTAERGQVTGSLEIRVADNNVRSPCVFPTEKGTAFPSFAYSDVYLVDVTNRVVQPIPGTY